MTTGTSAYEVLGVSKTATQAEIKKAYRKLALTVHPDRNQSDDAKERFQQLQSIYNVLSSPDKRKVYDRTGSMEDADVSDDFETLYEYFKAQCETVTTDKLDAFYDKYRGSREEHAELLETYTRLHGDIALLFEYMPCSDVAVDSHRFMDAIDAAIEEGTLESCKKYSSWRKTISKRKRPADPLAKRSKKQKEDDAGNEAALIAAIRGKGSGMDALAAKLEAKYGGTDEEPRKRSKKSRT